VWLLEQATGQDISLVRSHRLQLLLAAAVRSVASPELAIDLAISN